MSSKDQKPETARKKLRNKCFAEKITFLARKAGMGFFSISFT
jgi:hypothetical protein